MTSWADQSDELGFMLKLRTKIIAFMKLDQPEDLDTIDGVFRVDHLSTFCQVPFMARVQGLTVGVTRQDSILDRCMRIHGLKTASEKSTKAEAKSLATTWFASPEDALKQQADYPRIPSGGAIVVAPLVDEKFEPEVISVYGNPAQLMMLMCGLQKEKYEKLEFFFLGEGACANSLAQCYVSGKPSLAIPCYGERAFGQVSDDEIVIALPPEDLERGLSGMKKLASIGLRYPIRFIGGEADVTPMLSELYPDDFKR